MNYKQDEKFWDDLARSLRRLGLEFDRRMMMIKPPRQASPPGPFPPVGRVMGMTLAVNGLDGPEIVADDVTGSREGGLT